MNMTPKEKADELFNKHIDYFSVSDEVGESKALRAALTTVEEILSEYNGYRVKSYLTIPQVKEITEFWYEVKIELELLWE